MASAGLQIGARGIGEYPQSCPQLGTPAVPPTAQEESHQVEGIDVDDDGGGGDVVGFGIGNGAGEEFG
jgi:hypothetical protein